ncbi:hypothetical protein [Kitasatospora sp. NPDC085879]
MKRFTRSVAGQFTISAVACLVLFTVLWTLAAWVVGELVDDLPPLQK